MNAPVKVAAKLRGKARTARVEVKVREAMETIQREIKQNGGIYPRNNGAISMNEVARIANISLTTFFSPKQKALGKTVKAWVQTLKEKEIIGRVRVRRTIQERAEDWRQKCLAMQNTFVFTELELQDTKALLEEAEKKLSTLRTENASLLRQLRLQGSSQVASITKKNN
jgi:hypothetical protein